VRLARFIRDEAEPILAEWETVARSIVPGDTMDVTALRDHAKEMLLVIAEDLEAPQTDRAHDEKRLLPSRSFPTPGAARRSCMLAGWTPSRPRSPM